MKNPTFTIYQYLTSFFFSKKCVGCRARHTALCVRCLSTITPAKMTELHHVYGIFNYGNAVVQTALWKLKYKRDSSAAKILAQKGSGMLNEILADTLQSYTPQSLVFVPIPQHARKHSSRGFNQSELIAKWISETIAFSSVSSLLVKDKHTLPQSHIRTKTERLKNIAGSMRAKKRIDPTRTYIVIDDVTTTGATFLEAKRALIQSGAKHILCIALAHGYKKR